MFYKAIVSLVYLLCGAVVGRRLKDDKPYKWLLFIPPVLFVFLLYFDLLNINIKIGSAIWNLQIVLPLMICLVIDYLYLYFVAKKPIDRYELIVFPAIVIIDLAVKFFYGIYTDVGFNFYNDQANSYHLVLFALSYAFVEFSTIYALDIKSWNRDSWTTKAMICVFGYFFSFALIVGQYAINIINGKEGETALRSAMFVLMYLVIIVVILLVVYEMNKHFKNEKIRRQKETQQINEYYNKQVLLNQEELIKIKHDINNVLEVIKLKDETIFKELKDKIDKHNAVYYCKDELLNKILVLKASEAKKNGIQIDINAKIEGDLPFSEIEKISLFSNLLDNAITAASKSEDKTIKIGISYANKELDIDIVNSCDKLIKKSNIKYHGKGKDIINDIISKYDGTMIVYYANKRYSVDVKIDLQEASKNFENAKNYI